MRGWTSPSLLDCGMEKLFSFAEGSWNYSLSLPREEITLLPLSNSVLAQQQAILDALPVAAFLERRGRIFYANAVARDLVGWPTDMLADCAAELPLTLSLLSGLADAKDKAAQDRPAGFFQGGCCSRLESQGALKALTAVWLRAVTRQSSCCSPKAECDADAADRRGDAVEHCPSRCLSFAMKGFCSSIQLSRAYSVTPRKRRSARM